MRMGLRSRLLWARFLRRRQAGQAMKPGPGEEQRVKTIGAVFDTEDQVRTVYGRLQEAGVPGDDMGIVLREDIDAEHAREHGVHDADEVSGAVVGSAIGGTAGWVAGLGVAGASAAVPIVGPVLAAGAMLGVVSAAGGTLGWLAGGLTARGIEKDEAEYYENAVQADGIVLTVQTDESNVDRCRAILRLAGGREYQPA